MDTISTSLYAGAPPTTIKFVKRASETFSFSGKVSGLDGVVVVITGLLVVVENVVKDLFVVTGFLVVEGLLGLLLTVGRLGGTGLETGFLLPRPFRVSFTN